MKKSLLLGIGALLIGALLMLASCGDTPTPTPTPTPGPTPTPTPTTVDIFKNKTTDFQIVYAYADVNARNAQSDLGVRLSELDILSRSVADTRSEEMLLEILIGPTNRKESDALIEKVNARASGDNLTWGFSFDGHKFCIYATSKEAYSCALDDLFENYFKGDSLALADNLSRTSYYTRDEYQSILDRREQAEQKKLISTLVAKNSEFKTAQFGGTPATLTSPYPAPAVNPTRGQHPRVLITSNSLAGIRTAMETSESATAKLKYTALVKSTADGTLPAVTTGTNFDGELLAAIEAKALEYQLTGNKYRGYEAIIAIKNYILTLNVISGSDLYRQWGQTMLVAGEVYDWCYDLMTGNDREQIIRGVENILLAEGHMEIGLPPSKQSSVSSHGSEAQLLRDYMAFAIAVYDERPDFWAYVGGRFYQDYVPFRNYYYESGLAPQGSGLYGQYRHSFDLWAAWLIKTMSGVNPFSDKMEQVVLSFLAAELPLDKEIFATGDYYGMKNMDIVDKAGSDASAGRTYGLSSYLFHSALYDNGTSRAAAKYYSDNFTYFTYSNNYLNPNLYLILSGTGTETAADRHEGLPTVLYNGSPVGMLTSREAWNDPDSVAVMMKIGERTTSNHEHQDAGSFEIYYKGNLTSDSGVYGGYGSDHHYYYHQATVAHNSLLIYNPSLSSTQNGWYSGGQRRIGEAGNYAVWQGSNYTTGSVTGVSYGYTNGEGSKPTYAYLAGDITPAYDAQTVSEVERRMLTIYTSDEKSPAIFVVYDNITAKSGSFKKTFLLHTAVEPTISGNKITVACGGGQLTLFNLSGDSISKIGGSGKNYWVNGKQNAAASFLASDGMWGRAEISPATSSLTDTMLNVMIVSDAGTAVASPTSVSNADLEGFVLGNYAAFFAKTSAALKKAETVTVSGSGNVTYYFSGVAAGNWRVTVGSQTVGTFTVGAGEGLLTFTAPAGTVTITPAS